MGFRIVTVNNLDGFACISALQKSIRRGEERQAMLFALELAHSSKQCFTMMLNRLRVIAHEDIGLANPQAVTFVLTTCDTLANFHEKNGWRIMIGNCVRMLCRSAKSREGDHFATCCRVQLENEGPPKIPDYAWDKHTGKGRGMGRGNEHFITEATKLVPPQEGDDPYRDEAYVAWRKADGENAQPAGEEDDTEHDASPPKRARRHLF